MGRKKFNEGLARHTVNSKMTGLADMTRDRLEKGEESSDEHSDTDNNAANGELKPMIDKSAKDIARLQNT